MTLTDPKGGVAYVSGEIFTANDATTIASQLPYALDGNAGGNYPPTAPIVVSGSGMTITMTGTWPGSATLSGNHTLSGTNTVSGTLQSTGGTLSGTWAGNPVLSGQPKVTGLMTFSGSSSQLTTTGAGLMNGSWGGNITWTGSPGWTGTPQVYNGAKISVRSGAEIEWESGATLDCKSTATFTGNTNLNGTNSLGTTTLNGPTSNAGIMTDTAGRHVRNSLSLTSTANYTHTVNSGTMLYWQYAGGTLTLGSDSAVVGDVLFVCNSGTNTSAGSFNIRDDVWGLNGWGIDLPGMAGATFVFDGTNWRPVGVYNADSWSW